MAVTGYRSACDTWDHFLWQVVEEPDRFEVRSSYELDGSGPGCCAHVWPSKRARRWRRSPPIPKSWD